MESTQGEKAIAMCGLQIPILGDKTEREGSMSGGLPPGVTDHDIDMAADDGEYPHDPMCDCDECMEICEECGMYPCGCEE